MNHPRFVSPTPSGAPCPNRPASAGFVPGGAASIYTFLDTIRYGWVTLPVEIASEEKSGRVESRLEKLCVEKGLKMTGQRRVIARVLSDASDHPDVEQVYNRAAAIDPRISIATVYRTLRVFEEASILSRHEFGSGRSRYEEAREDHHDHLIDIQSGRVIEFRNETIEALQQEIARELGYRLVGHRLELYASPLSAAPKSEKT